MCFNTHLAATLLGVLGALATPLTFAAPDVALGLRPSEAAARENAFAIFNAVHSATRQWGSSLNHNGMSLFLVTIPQGVLLHHGTDSPTPPAGPEWLAFEIDHAELFAHPRRRFRKPPPSARPSSPPVSPIPEQAQHRLLLLPRGTDYTDDDDDGPHDPPRSSSHGYLHLYRTTAPLALLYLDGTSAGNTAMGTLDTQDLLLRLNRSSGRDFIFDERARARELCDIAQSWGGGALHGVLRMEAGFEVIKCGEFLRGMELVSVLRRDSREDDPPRSGDDPGVEVRTFEFVRAVAARYHGLGAGRVVVDWSSMVSAFFYDVDLTNPETGDARLPRLVRLTDAELRAIRARVAEVAGERQDGGKRVLDWQGVVDMVVSRYAERLRYMAEGVDSLRLMRAELNALLDAYIDYATEEGERYEDATRRCAKFYTAPVAPETQEDRLILTAIETVTKSICSSLFEARALVAEDSSGDSGSSLEAAKRILQELMDRLRWTKWKECVGCGFDEVCFVPMWPFGDKGSYERPNCRNATSITDGWWDNNCWDPDRRMGVRGWR